MPEFLHTLPEHEAEADSIPKPESQDLSVDPELEMDSLGVESKTESDPSYREEVMKFVDALRKNPDQFEKAIEEMRRDEEALRARKEKLAKDIAFFENRLEELAKETKNHQEKLAEYKRPSLNDKDFIAKADYMASMINTLEWLAAQTEDVKGIIQRLKSKLGPVDDAPSYDGKERRNAKTRPFGNPDRDQDDAGPTSLAA